MTSPGTRCPLGALGSRRVSIFARVVTVFALILGALSSPAFAATPGRSEASTRLIAVGDLHGDYEAFLEILRAAGVIDARGRWSAADATFVQTGDIADRGPDSLRIIRHLMRLQRAAARAGGRVVVLVGNHEAMNVTGDLRYVHPGEFAAFADRSSERRRERAYETNRAAIESYYRERNPGMASELIRRTWLEATPLGKVEHQAAWSPEGELGRWTMANPAVVLIGGTLFVHGGISAEYAGLSIEEINRRTAAALAARETAPESIINDPLGPLWYRGLVMRAEPGAERRSRLSVEDEIAAVLRSYGARRMVVGHTPSLEGIRILHGGRVIAIDTGISRHYGGRRTYLEIRGDEVIPRTVGRDSAAAARMPPGAGER